jgi:hypothetical protein
MSPDELAIVYFYIEKIIMQAYEQNPEFYSQTLEEKQAAVDELAEQIKGGEEKTLPPPPTNPPTT